MARDPVEDELPQREARPQGDRDDHVVGQRVRSLAERQPATCLRPFDQDPLALHAASSIEFKN
ncbi:hypothetical protein D3C86_2034410 [compost metagenome]